MTRSAPAVITVTAPFDGHALLQFLAARAIPGVEAIDGHRYSRTVRLPGGPGVIRLTLRSRDDTGDRDGRLTITMESYLSDPADRDAAIGQCRHLIDADADAPAIVRTLGDDPALAESVTAAPGLRVPGSVDGPEILIRALVGQQVSVAAARTALAKLTVAAGEALPAPIGGLTHLFPAPAAIAELGAAAIAGPRRRAAAIAAAAEDMAAGRLVIDSGRNATTLTADLVARPSIGPWTAGYVCMRVLREPDTLLIGDLALRRGATALGLADSVSALSHRAERWRPFRSYAGMYLWRAAGSGSPRRPARRPTPIPEER